MEFFEYPRWRMDSVFVRGVARGAGVCGGVTPQFLVDSWVNLLEMVDKLTNGMLFVGKMWCPCKHPPEVVASQRHWFLSFLVL